MYLNTKLIAIKKKLFTIIYLPGVIFDHLFPEFEFSTIAPALINILKKKTKKNQ